LYLFLSSPPLFY
jgi:hypothetical protein